MCDEAALFKHSLTEQQFPTLLFLKSLRSRRGSSWSLHGPSPANTATGAKRRRSIFGTRILVEAVVWVRALPLISCHRQLDPAEGKGALVQGSLRARASGILAGPSRRNNLCQPVLADLLTTHHQRMGQTRKGGAETHSLSLALLRPIHSPPGLSLPLVPRRGQATRF